MSGRRKLLLTDAQHRRGEVNADDASGWRLTRSSSDREVGGSRAEIKDALASCEGQGANCGTTPASVDAGAQQVIEEVVPAGNRVEHAGDTLGRLREIGTRWRL